MVASVFTVPNQWSCDKRRAPLWVAARRVTFAYELPASVLRLEEDSWVYSLVVQKQLGTLDTPVKVTVTVPARYRIEGANPSPTILDDEKAQFLFSLNSIYRLELVLRAE